MEYETYETYETAYETDAAYDDIYAGDSKAKVAKTLIWIWFRQMLWPGKKPHGEGKPKRRRRQEDKFGKFSFPW